MSRKLFYISIIHSPHMLPLLNSLSDQGFEVTYVALSNMPEHRVNMGWMLPETSVNLVHAIDFQNLIALIDDDAEGSFIMLGGLRGHALFSKFLRWVKRRNLSVSICLEQPDFNGFYGFFRKAYYKFIFFINNTSISHVFAIGKGWSFSLKRWLGIYNISVYDFAYFHSRSSEVHIRRNDFVKSVFIGELIDRKNISILFELLLFDHSLTLDIVGVGVKELELKKILSSYPVHVKQRVNWLGVIPMDKIQSTLSSYDVLFLPSKHDGWGAVVIEALTTGVPVICSDRCGSNSAVLDGVNGYVFSSSCPGDLIKKYSCFKSSIDYFRSNSDSISDSASKSYDPAIGAMLIKSALSS